MRILILYFFLAIVSFLRGQDIHVQETEELLQLFENEIAKSQQFDSLGILKHSVELSTSISSISNDQFIKEINESLHESFYIKVDRHSLRIVAATKKALEHGIYFYLHHLGYRYYFANPIWHYYPDIKTIFKPIEGVFGPDYLNRRIRYNFGTGSEKATSDFNFWQKANLLGESIPGFTGHSYGQIIKRNKKQFLEHPEYFAQTVQKGRIPKDPKFDISNPDLVKLVISDALKVAEKYEKKYGPGFIISMDPSDFGGYCKKPNCKKWKSESDQVYYLANQVAKELKIHFPKAYVGLYAYYLHAAPPSFALEDNMIIYIATAFNKSSLSFDDLVKQWKAKVEHIGIRDYFGVANWDWDLPGQGKGTKPLQIHEIISTFYNEDARFYYIETLNGWITKGLGHYIAAQSLWDISVDPKDEIEKFYELMFPETRKIMQPLMEQLLYYTRETPLDKDLKVWIENAFKAHELAGANNEKKRVEDVLQYLYAVSLFVKRNKDDVKSYDVLYKFLNQINDNSNYAAYAIRRVLFPTFRKIMPGSIINTRTSALNYNSHVEINFVNGLDSILNILTPIDWEPYEFEPNELEFESLNKISNRSSSAKPIIFRENHLFLIQVNKKSRIRIKEGIVTYKNLKGGQAILYTYKDEQLEKPIKKFQLFPDSVTDLRFSEFEPGIYWLKIIDNREGFKLVNQVNCHVAVYQDMDHPLNTFYRNDFYFYVPETVASFVVRKTGSATIFSPSGRLIDLEKYDKTNLKVEVNKEEYGYWKVENQKGTFFIEGIPPFFAKSKNNLPKIEEKKCFLKFWK